MKDTKVKYKRKPTPIRSAIFWISLTSNLYLGTLAYGVYNGQVSRAEVAAQPVDFVGELAQARR